MSANAPEGGLRISAVVPLFNKEATIWSCLASISSQHTPVSEVVIVDDGSTDGSAAIAAEALDHFSLPGKIVKQPNEGVSSARNAGIRAAASDYIAFLDADDEWESDFIDRMTSLIRDFPEAALYGSAHCCVTGDEVRIVRPNVAPGFRGYLSDFFFASLSGAAINSSKVVAARTSIEEIGGFPAGAAVAEDLYVWMRVASKYKVAFDDFVGARVTIVRDESGRSRRGIPYPVTYYANVGLQVLPPSGRVFIRRVVLTYCLNKSREGDAASVAECALAARRMFPFLARGLELLALAPPWVSSRCFYLGRKCQKLLRFRTA